MRRRSRTLLVALGLVATACALRGPRPDATLAPVGLLTTGSAFERSGVREDVVRAVERASGRRVLVLGAPASVDSPRTKALAARLTKENPHVAGYDWREPRCTSHAAVLTAVENDVDAVYQVTLDVTERTRSLTEAEAAQRSGLSDALGAVHLVAAKTAREEVLAGRVEVTGFGPRGSGHAPVSRETTSVEPSVFTPRLDVSAAVGEALAKLPPVASPHWEREARALTTAGCPFLALVVSETRLEPSNTRTGLRKTAVAAVTRTVAKRATPRTRKEAAPPPRELAVPEPRGSDDRYSCSALCSIHMVQLCNNDRILWTSHHTKWETTPCGTRRDEPFLKDCYRQQWLSSTFREACVQPCERTTEGRERLLRVLQEAGCVIRSETS